MNSVFTFLLDLVYDWDNVESYEYLVPGIDDESVDILDIVDDVVDSTSVMRFTAQRSEPSGLARFVYSIPSVVGELNESAESIPLSPQGVPWWVLREYGEEIIEHHTILDEI